EDPLKPFVQPPHFAPFTFGVNPREYGAASARAWQALHPDLTWTSPHCTTWRNRPLSRRIRIGFLTQPTYPLIWGIARELDRERFEVVMLSEESVMRAGNAPWLDAVDRRVTIPDRTLAEGREAIAAQELDILVHLPWFGFRYFMSHARLAPVQCV